MKKCLALGILLLSLATLAGCKQEKLSEVLIGKWEYEVLRSEKGDEFHTLSEWNGIDSSFLDPREHGIINFYDDGSFEINTKGQKEVYAGEYVFNGQTVYLDYEKGEESLESSVSEKFSASTVKDSVIKGDSVSLQKFLLDYGEDDDFGEEFSGKFQLKKKDIE